LYFFTQIHSIITFLNLFLYYIFCVIFNDMNSVFAISYGNQNQSLQYMLRVHLIWQKKRIKFLRIQMEKMVIESEGREGELIWTWRSWAENGARDSIRKWIIRLPCMIALLFALLLLWLCVRTRTRERNREIGIGRGFCMGWETDCGHGGREQRRR